jgi:hypothetical protein
MASFMSSADSERLLQLRIQLEQFTISKQHLERLEEFQQVSLMNVIDNVATLEKQNAQLKQILRRTLQTLDAKKDSNNTLRTRCEYAVGQIGRSSQANVNECSFRSKSKSQVFLKTRAQAEPHPEPCLVSPALPDCLPNDFVQVATQLPHDLPALDLVSKQSSEHIETEKTEVSPSGSSRQTAWPANATTVLIRNMPPRSTIDELIKAFPPDGSYDLINLPFSVKARRTSSFVIINFVTVAFAEAFCARFDGQRLPHSTRSHKNPLSITAAQVQGLEANLVRLREDKGLQEMRNAGLLPRLYLTGAAAERLASRCPKSVKQPDEADQPRRLDFREVLSTLEDAEV